MTKLRTLIATIFFFACFLETASAADEYSFEVADTTISGLLLGNFVMLGNGEMLKGQILYLDRPIDIKGNKESAKRRNRKSVRNVDRLLLKFETSSPPDDAAGANVEIVGTLNNAPSDPHHTKVEFVVRSLSVVSEPEGDRPVARVKTH